MTDVFTRHESNVRSYCRDFPVVFTRAEGHHHAGQRNLRTETTRLEQMIHLLRQAMHLVEK